MEITRHELTILNFYRVSELYGGLILGRMVGRARDAQLIHELTRHSAEEVMHAQLWTETILDLGGRPFPTRDTYQARYAAHVGRPISMLHVLALTQVFERRVYRHFLAHLHHSGTHPRVKQTLQQMIEEEKHHLSWVKHWLDDQGARRGVDVECVLNRYTEADEAVYSALVEEMGWRKAA